MDSGLVFKEKVKRSSAMMLVMCALMAALTAVCSQIQIPLPMVPINLALFRGASGGALLAAQRRVDCNTGLCTLKGL